MRRRKHPGLLACGFSVALVAVPWPSQQIESERDGIGLATEATLRPTVHAPLPADPTEAWFVPDDDTRRLVGRSSGLRQFRAGVEAYKRGDLDTAAAAWNGLDLSGTPLADYLDYYRGLVALGRGEWSEARQRFASLRRRAPVGYLSEAAAIGEARAAEGAGDYAAALGLYAQIAPQATKQSEAIWRRLGEVALAVGDRVRAAQAFARVRYEYPLSAAAAEVGRVLADLGSLLGSARTRAQRELERAERLFGARRYDEARAAFLAVRPHLSAAERRRVDLRIAACDLARRQPIRARDRLRPYLGARREDPELNALYLSVLRRLGRRTEFVRGVAELAERFPTSPWTEQALDELATYHLGAGERAEAARVFQELVARFPTGSRAERAAWHAGWWAYRTGDYRTTVRLFEQAAATFPRSDYRPAYLYWAARARDRLGDTATARTRYELVLVDYGQSYYGRLAARRLADRGLARSAVRTAWPVDQAAVGGTRSPDLAIRDLIAWLLALELYDEALDEIAYAARRWGRTATLDATEAWIHYRRGDFRRGINLMKRAYPHYLAEIGADLPEALQQVLFPLAYRDVIERHGQATGIDPFVLAALIAQESSFDPAIRSRANAYGLMQLLPATGRRMARALGVRQFRPSLLTDPEWNVRLGTSYLARLLDRFGAVHLALAAYNAGENRVVRWLAERGDVSPEEFIEDIPFEETRTYLKKVLGTAEDYRRLYGGGSQPTP